METEELYKKLNSIDIIKLDKIDRTFPYRWALKKATQLFMTERTWERKTEKAKEKKSFFL